jgi:hypothetical protein
MRRLLRYLGAVVVGVANFVWFWVESFSLESPQSVIGRADPGLSLAGR